MKNLLQSLTVIIITASIFGCSAANFKNSCTSKHSSTDYQVSISNPYAAVDWQEFGRYRASLHNHTLPARRNSEEGTVIYANGEIRNSDGDIMREGDAQYHNRNPHPDFRNSQWKRVGGSDGRHSAAGLIDAYHSLGYSILSITDHNRNTWQWQYFGRDSEELEMIEISGNELSRDHHIGSYFSNLETSVRGESEQIEKVGEAGGLAVMFHPGRYSRKIDWYVELYQDYDHLVGMEVYNQGDRYSGDRKIWDNVLTKLMPERPVWGYSNDDTHRQEHVARNWNVFILEELTEENVRAAMKSGQFYFCYSPKQDGCVPVINLIEVDNDELTITIGAEGYESIVWISQGEKVHTGHTLCLIKAAEAGAKGYVRARLIGEEGFTYTQPFAIKTEKYEQQL